MYGNRYQTAIKAINIIIFAFAAITIMIRPVLTPVLLAGNGPIRSSHKMAFLFQQLIKKRDSIYSDASDMDDCIVTEYIVVPPVLRLLIQKLYILFLNFPLLVITCRLKRTVFWVCPDNRYYQKLSRLQI